MGLSQYCYLGPYVQASYRTESREVEVYGCTNPGCPEYAKRTHGFRPAAKFCSACASAIGPSKKIEAARTSVHEALGDSEALAPLGYDNTQKLVWLGSNYGKRGGAPRDFDLDPEATRVDLESSHNAVAEKKWFEERFAEDINRLRAAYDNVQILWGLHLYRH